MAATPPSWETEIVELHDFFEELFLGTTRSLERAEQALDQGFTMAGPHGTVTSRAQVMSQLEAGIAHTTELLITIEEPQLIVETDELVVAGYIECHTLREGRSNRRRSTVVFRKDRHGPNGLRWLRVQETWIEPTA